MPDISNHIALIFPTNSLRLDPARPTFFLPGVLSGTLQVHGCHSDGARKVKIVLSGVLQNGISCGISSINLAQQYILNQPLLELVDVQQVPSTTTANPVVSLPFFFRVGDRNTDDPDSPLSYLTPSLSVGKRNTLGTGTDARAYTTVRYELLEHLLPPIPLDDFPGEYICSSTKPLRSKKIAYLGIGPWSSTQHLAVSVSEPAVIALDPGGEPLDSVTVALGVRLSLLGSDEHPDLPPDSMDFSLEWALRSTTFISVVPMQAAPTHSQSVASPVLVAITKLSAKHNTRTAYSDQSI
ncbi:hypothetical protein B0A55_11237, partial [Friedmanniomyces simplex]